MQTFYVTTPIYYATDKPHVGHAYTTVAADVLVRYWRRKLGEDQTFFLVGTDEHGQKIAQAAEKAGLEPQAFVNSLIPRFHQAWAKLGIDPSIFMRTTDPQHESFARDYFAKLHEQGDVYKSEYEGIYCIGCESYKTETELVPSTSLGTSELRCPDHPNLTPERRKEENYFFRLTKYVPRVIDAILGSTLRVEPRSRRAEILARLQGEVRDISISRPSVTWGIPIPWDETQTIYVWVEALLNYLSALEIAGKPELWPATVQLMGKEILWFHAVIWPALLLAGGRELPQTIFAHGWFTIDGQKMSNTVGNVIDPIELVDEWGTDPVRYFLLSAVPFGSDGDIQPSRFAEIYTADLANGLGNLLNRTVTLLSRSGITVEPGAQPSCADVDQAIEDLRLDEGLKAIMQIVNDANKRLETAKPWELLTKLSGFRFQVSGEGNASSSKRSKAEGSHLEPESSNLKAVLTTAYRQLETIAAGLEPYLPQTSAKILEQLTSGRAKPLFPRKER